MKRKMLWMIVTFFVAFNMLFTVTARPVVSKDASRLTNENQEQEIEDLGGDGAKLLLLKLFGLDSLYGSGLIIEECWNAYENTEVMTKYDQTKFDLAYEIGEMLEGADAVYMQRALDIDVAFSISKFVERIQSLTIENIIEDIMMLSDPPTKSTFKEDYAEYIEYLLNILANNDMDIEVFTQDCANLPTVICAFMRAVARVYTSLLYVFGADGLRLACHVTYVLFAPLISKTVLLDATIESLKYGDVGDKLLEIYREKGLVGLLTEGRDYLLNYIDGLYSRTSQYNKALTNVLSLLLPCKKEGVIFRTSEEESVITNVEWIPYYPKHKEIVTFFIEAHDNDYTEKIVKKYRDSVRLGIDTDQDYEVDHWLLFNYNEETNDRSCSWSKRVTNTKYVFWFITIDQWGVRSAWDKVYLHVSADRSVTTPLSLFPNLQQFFRMFPMLEYLLAQRMTT